jgi:hypothetical protein
LALTKNAYYKDFDDKSVEFVEAGLQLIEKKFTGSETLEVTVGETPEEEEKIKLSYFKSITSSSKVYNKILIP